MSISIFLSDNTSYIGKELSAAITQSDNELITQKADSTLGETLLQCDAVVLNLNGNSDEVTSIMTFLKSQELDNEITVIGVSTLLTWASTKKSDRDQIFSERSYKKRKSSVQFKPVKLLESLVLNSQKENLNTYVVAPGILYGKGEHEFHHLFKNGWLCEEPALPILGNGNNRLPTIHVTDLASIILATAQAPPIDQQYIVAVDGGQASQKEIVESISTGLGNGQTVHVEVTSEKVLLNEVGNAEVLLSNMRFEQGFVGSLDTNWVAPSGIPESIDTLRREFITERGLTPVRIMLHGAPGSGKSFYANQLSSKYYVPVIRIKDVIDEVMNANDEWTEKVMQSLVESEAAGKDSKSKVKVKGKRPSSKKKGSASNGSGINRDGFENARLSASMLTELVRRKLKTPACRNKGFILDGYPRTLEETKLLFTLKNDDDEDEDGDTGAAAVMDDDDDDDDDDTKKEKSVPKDGNYAVQYVISLDCTYESALERCKNLPDALSDDAGANINDEGRFKRRWATSSDVNDMSKDVVTAPLSYSFDVEVLDLPAGTAGQPAKALETMALYLEKSGKAFNYHPTLQEQEEEKRVLETKERLLREQEQAELMMKEEREREERALSQEQNQVRREKVLMEDMKLVEACSMPLRGYLMDNVIPALVDGLLDVSKTKPDDPIDYLAEFLFQYAVSSKSSSSAADDSAELKTADE